MLRHITVTVRGQPEEILVSSRQEYGNQEIHRIQEAITSGSDRWAYEDRDPEDGERFINYMLRLQDNCWVKMKDVHGNTLYDANSTEDYNSPHLLTLGLPRFVPSSTQVTIQTAGQGDRVIYRYRAIFVSSRLSNLHAVDIMDAYKALSVMREERNPALNESIYVVRGGVASKFNYIGINYLSRQGQVGLGAIPASAFRYSPELEEGQAAEVDLVAAPLNLDFALGSNAGVDWNNAVIPQNVRRLMHAREPTFRVPPPAGAEVNLMNTQRDYNKYYAHTWVRTLPNKDGLHNVFYIREARLNGGEVEFTGSEYEAITGRNFGGQVKKPEELLLNIPSLGMCNVLESALYCRRIPYRQWGKGINERILRMYYPAKNDYGIGDYSNNYGLVLANLFNKKYPTPQQAYEEVDSGDAIARAINSKYALTSLPGRDGVFLVYKRALVGSFNKEGEVILKVDHLLQEVQKLYEVRNA